jgi:AcrR family transcriptional regulator
VGRAKRISDAQVLDALGEVLLRRGPHAFTLREVTRACGLAPATLLQRFGSRAGLLRAFTRHASEGEAAAARHPPRARRGAPLTALVDALVRRAAPLAQRTALANSMALLLEDVRRRPLRALAARQAEAVELQLQAQLARAAREGALATHVDPRALARTLWATWNGALIQWALRGDGVTLERWLRDALDAVLALARRDRRRPGRVAFARSVPRASGA